MRRSTAVILLAAAAPAIAQDDAVVVTATRAPQSALEIPAAVDRIYGDELREGRPQVNLSESLGRVPGISVQNRQNYAQDLQIQSRGFGARSTFGVRGIRLVADGIPATMPDGQGQAATFSLGSAERIEVLRGPFSALYGNASGGVIAVETQDAPPQPFGEASLMVGSWRTWRGGLKAGGEAAKGTGSQAAGANIIADVSRFETQGYRDHSETTRDHLNAKLKVRLQEATTFTLVANSLHQPDAEDPLGLTRAQYDENPRQATPQALQFNTRKTVHQSQLGGTLSHRFGASRAEVMLYSGTRGVEQFLAIPIAVQTATPTHAGGVIELDREYGGGALRLSTEVNAWRFSFGVEHDAMHERRKGFINNNGTANELRRDEDNRVTSTDFYGQAEWKFAERWALHGGIRRSAVRFSSSDYYVVAGNPNDSGARTYHAVTPVAGLVWRPTQQTSVYGNFGRGFETPTFLEIAYRNDRSGLNFDLEASRSRHAEVGVKSVLPQRARLSAALFYVVTENEIVVDQNSGGRATFKNVGHTDRRGLELGAETLLGGRFEARAAYTYLRAVFREGFDTVQGTTPVTVASGAQLPGTSRNQLFGELRYRQAPFHAALEGLYRSRVPANDPNSEYADAFTVFNLFAGLTQQGGAWKLTEYVRMDNVADRKYAGSVIVNETNARYYEPAPRRSMSVGIQASLTF